MALDPSVLQHFSALSWIRVGGREGMEFWECSPGILGDVLPWNFGAALPEFLGMRPWNFGAPSLGFRGCFPRDSGFRECAPWKAAGAGGSQEFFIL